MNDCLNIRFESSQFMARKKVKIPLIASYNNRIISLYMEKI